MKCGNSEKKLNIQGIQKIFKVKKKTKQRVYEPLFMNDIGKEKYQDLNILGHNRLAEMQNTNGIINN